MAKTTPRTTAAKAAKADRAARAKAGQAQTDKAANPDTNRTGTDGNNPAIQPDPGTRDAGNRQTAGAVPATAPGLAPRTGKAIFIPDPTDPTARPVEEDPQTRIARAKAREIPLELEQPPSAELRHRTVAQERDQEIGSRVDGTTARHTEPLGPPAPGQQGRPGPERRVFPGNQETALAPTVGATPFRSGKTIKVAALKMGYVGEVRRRAGDIFLCPVEEFSERWMQPVDEATPLKVTTGKQELKRLHDETLAGKAQAADRDPLGANSPSPRA